VKPGEWYSPFPIPERKLDAEKARRNSGHQVMNQEFLARNGSSFIYTDAMQASGFITAGGRSSRMGRDKAWLDLQGRPMIEWVIEALKPVASSIHLIASSADYARLGFPVLADTHTGVGPLEAIRVALANSPSPWALLVGCDMPFVTAELFTQLVKYADQPSQHLGLSPHDSAVAAVVPLNSQGLLEPLCALYSVTALSTVSELIEAGERKVSRLFDRVATRFVTFDEIKQLPGSSRFFENINTPDEYESVQKSQENGANNP
jgi:molybdopterin-guanine dinucleotide biosynthesis protein A